jgi:hypothetical protein
MSCHGKMAAMVAMVCRYGADFPPNFSQKSCWVSAANELDPVLGKKLLLLLLLQHHHTSV